MSRTKPTLVDRVTAGEERDKSIETRLEGVETNLTGVNKRLSGIESILEELKGPLKVLTDARGFWAIVNKGFAGLGYIAVTSAAIAGAWKLFFAH